ncbi:MAG: hypothetical protein U1F57_01445 [bacterium]
MGIRNGESVFSRVASYSSRSISVTEFAMEMLLGVPRGVGQMWSEAKEHPGIVAGVVGSILFVSHILPTSDSRWFSTGLLLVGSGISGVFVGKGLAQGVDAWCRNDRTCLRAASVDFGVGVVSFTLSVAGVKLGQRFSDTAMAHRFGLMGNLLHSTDEIAAALSLSRGANSVK